MRTRTVLKGVTGLGVAALLLTSGALPAVADTPPTATSGTTATAGDDLLLLTVAGVAPNTATAPRAATLDCGAQATGDHPAAAAACADLVGVQGDFAALAPSHSYCPALYLPVTATAAGLWDGQPVSYQQTFTNQCSLERATGEVFAF
ncbi:SSI family serine proteinase inhibitor [Kitasatospora sp. LaBMicrA B282]|uniref:SSI family serine proteinase inhibitor n=1 Tax=Kitasatospora sp. LaBMicrA B282 TaxID=3420949 RepID=UPI003D111328